MTSVRDISSLSIKTSEVETLYKCGFRLLSDIESLQPSDLASETGLSLERSLHILRMAKVDGSDPTTVVSGKESGVSALEITNRSRGDRPIISFSREMDVMLGGGVQISQITEFVVNKSPLYIS